jgi:hypothetical protein
MVVTRFSSYSLPYSSKALRSRITKAEEQNDDEENTSITALCPILKYSKLYLKTST